MQVSIVFFFLFSLLLHRHLDPFGSSVNFLDAAFRNVRNLGIVSITSTDISSLYAKAQQVAQRHYGCNVVRTEYYKELAARMVVAAVARYCFSFELWLFSTLVLVRCHFVQEMLPCSELSH